MITTRLASPADSVRILRLYHAASAGLLEDTSFLDLPALERSLDSRQSPEQIWLLAEDGVGVEAREDALPAGVLKVLVDTNLRIGRLERVYIAPQGEDDGNEDRIFDALISAFTAMLRAEPPRIDVVYCTTHNFTHEQHARTLGLGFTLLGVFPHAPGNDSFAVGGLSALFVDPAWRSKRRAGLALHPTIGPWFDIVRETCELAPLAVGEGRMSRVVPDVDPELEMIVAPAFVARTFRKHCDNHILPQHFYPFHSPNCVMTDADQTVEVFLHIGPGETQGHFATIIAEHVERVVDPTQLYRRVIALLRRARVGYVEVLIDAADSAGVEAALDAGFLPYAYFPSFKAHGESRRDFVVFGLAHENRMRVPRHLHPAYRRFLDVYLQQSRL